MASAPSLPYNSLLSDVCEEEWIDRISLSMVPGIGPITTRKILERFGSAGEVLKTSRFKLEEAPGVGWSSATSIKKFGSQKERATEELEFIKKRRLKPLFIKDSNYPFRLKQIPDAPVVLYTRGFGDLNTQRVASVVGTRRATEEGLDITQSLVRGLKAADVSIVSGLAYGIDYAAHSAALKNELPTFGVLAHGLDRVYPFDHSVMASEMLRSGGLITEFPSGTKPDRPNFPQRNRLIAGLCDVTIVVEAAEKGGALITARFSADYSREVLAVPGRVHDTYSRGCNNLIKDQIAGLVNGHEDVLLAMNWSVNDVGQKQIEPFIKDLPKPEKRLYNLIKLGREAQHDDLYYESGLSHSELSLALINLELKGLIKALPMKKYRLVA